MRITRDYGGTNLGDSSQIRTCYGHGDCQTGGGEPGSDLPGMMSVEEMNALESAEGEALEQMWQEMMVEHHEGAIKTASAATSEGGVDCRR
ncbi:DUF305 domain-containing protein [Nocardioides sp. Root190]|uniref:DUF305 domain-containing protein n=1 Tax=Nocardioides sp. Root190 TaxID=1736488 RepID=UPI0012F7C283|nr:DUF305 domain-containing protein [Nocardioides sp. Root190]